MDSFRWYKRVAGLVISTDKITGYFVKFNDEYAGPNKIWQQISVIDVYPTIGCLAKLESII